MSESLLMQILSQLNGMNSTMKEIKDDLSVVKEDVAGLKEDVAVLKEDVAGLKEKVFNIEVVQHQLQIASIETIHLIKKNEDELRRNSILVDILSSRSLTQEAAIKSLVSKVSGLHAS